MHCTRIANKKEVIYALRRKYRALVEMSTICLQKLLARFKESPNNSAGMFNVPLRCLALIADRGEAVCFGKGCKSERIYNLCIFDSCKNPGLQQVSLRFLYFALTQNILFIALPHLCGAALEEGKSTLLFENTQKTDEVRCLHCQEKAYANEYGYYVALKDALICRKITRALTSICHRYINAENADEYTQGTSKCSACSALEGICPEAQVS